MHEYPVVTPRKIFMVVLASLLCAYAGTMLDDAPARAAAEQTVKAQVELQMKAERAIRAAQDVMRGMLVEPGSAQFSNVRYMPSTGAVCGFVNGRNRLGGYAGKISFVMADGRVHHANTAAYNRWC